MAKKQKFTIEVTIDEEVLREEYPNFHFNYDNAEQFAKSLVVSINKPDYGYKAKLIKPKK